MQCLAIRLASAAVLWGLGGIFLTAPFPAFGAEDIVYKEEPIKLQPLPPPGTPVTRFEPSALVPYFQNGPLAKASERLRSGNAAEALRLVDELWAQPGAKAALDSDPRAQFLRALAELRTAEAASRQPSAGSAFAERAAAHFDALFTAYPLLRSYHAFYAGRAYLLAQQPSLALLRMEQVASDSVLDCDARYFRAEALRRLAEVPAAPGGTPSGSANERAIRAYGDFSAACPFSSHRRDGELALAQKLDSAGRFAEALLIWRRLYIEAPHEVYAAVAGKRLEQLGPKGKAAPFSATELLQRAQILFENMRNAESESAYRWALEQPDLDGAQRCVARYHLAQSVFKQRERPRAAPLFDDAIVACAPAAAKNDDLHMKALYQSARCHASAGQLQQAADLFAAAEAAHPGHSYADDARLRQAEMYQDLADRLLRDGPKKTCQADTCPDYEARLSTLLGELPDRYPAGDKRAEALWRLALRALRKQDLNKARSFLEISLAKIPREAGWAEEGRTLYWLGRVAELQKDGSTAARFYRRTAEEYPLSFYTLLALERLRAGFGNESSRLLTMLGGAEARSEDDGFGFQPRALFAHEAFLRGAELLRLGLGSEARREFQSIGIGPAEERAKVAVSAERAELLWLAAVLFDRASAWHLSHIIPRHVLTDWQRHYPVGIWRKYWLLAYPRGFFDLLFAAAQQNGQPESLQLAIVREESAFDARTESFANAVGLTQMIQPTAKRFAAGLPYDRDALRDPSINVAIGARFLGFLWQLWQQNPALTIASYNAGEGAVTKWLKTNADTAEIDLFIEAIPYDETRGYTKRVLSSYLIYQWLYSEVPPGAPSDIRLPAFMFSLPAGRPKNL